VSAIARSATPAHHEVDVAVIGAGVAALAAALAAREGKVRLRVVGGPRGLSHLASGVWDRGDLATIPSALRNALAVTRRSAERAVLLALGGYRAVPFRADDRPLVATAEGTLRRVLTAERNVLDLAPLPRARVAVVGFAALPSWSPHAIARSLDEDAVRRGDARRFFAVELEHARRAHDVLLGGAELARVHDAPRARERLAVAIARALAELPCDAVLLPPVLGSHGESVVSHLERALGRAVGEIVAGRSIQSERLAARLEAALTQLERVPEDAERLTLEDDRVVVHTAGGRIAARAVAVCTGRGLPGTLGADALLGVPVGPGVPVDGEARVRAGGGLVSTRVHAGGTLVAGLDPARGVALGLVAASGWRAGASATRTARA
jgi:glycerol-3-phosphate dehydrogenase subunit B